MRPGDTGWRVRVLQSRLHQLDLHSEVVTNRFDARDPHRRRHLPAPPRLDRRRRRRRAHVAQDRVPHDRAHLRRAAQRLHARVGRCSSAATPACGCARCRRGCKQVRWYDGRRDRSLRPGPPSQAVRGFQAKRRIPVTGAGRPAHAHAAQGDDPRADAAPSCSTSCPQGPALDPRCITGRAMCVDKTSRSLRWVVDGVVLETVEVRFGSDELPTREGAFSVFRKSRDHVSSLYDTSMPFAMFFSGGPGRPLLPRLRRQRLRRRVPRVRQRARPRRGRLALRPGPARRQGHRLPVLTRSATFGRAQISIWVESEAVAGHGEVGAALVEHQVDEQARVSLGQVDQV